MIYILIEILIFIVMILLTIELIFDLTEILCFSRSIEKIVANITSFVCMQQYKSAPEIFKVLLENAPAKLIDRYGAYGTSNCSYSTINGRKEVEVTLYGEDLIASVLSLKSPWSFMSQTAFHELGHAIDFAYGQYFVSGRLFKRALEFDKRTINVRTMGLNSHGYPGNRPISRIMFLMRNRGKLILEERGIEDILDIVSDGNIPVVYAHSRKYYEESPQNRYNEIFANLISLYASKDYKALRRLAKDYKLYHLVDRFVSWINEMCIEFNIKCDEELNNVLK